MKRRTILSSRAGAEYKLDIPILGRPGSVWVEEDESLSWYSSDAMPLMSTAHRGCGGDPTYRAMAWPAGTTTWCFPSIGKNMDDEGPEEWRALVALLL